MTIDQELQRALGVEPSPEFVARVRRRIDEEPEPWRWARPLPLSIVAIGAAAVVTLALFVLRPASIGPDADPRLVSRTLPRISVPALQPEPLRTTAPADAVAARTTPMTRRGEEAEILIDPREAAALRRLVSGRPLNLVEPVVARSLAPIEIVPLSIEPLPAGGEGVRE
jgi:hypothetical protein